ncbi:MAG: DNA gyrase subunit B [Fimbriiglobus sp.]
MSVDTEAGYTADNMKTLRDAAHIRQNPDMYVGNTQQSGLHHLVYEIVYNSVDEALAGYCKHISIVTHVDGSISIVDDGRGIPVDVKADTGKSALEEALTVVGNSGKFDNDAYKVSAGLHGMGAKAMNALSEWAVAEVRRKGRVHKMEFSRGYATSKLQDIGPANQTGTTITFKPDAQIFGTLTFDHESLSDRFRELAFLNRGLSLSLHDERSNRSENFKFDGGIAEYVKFLNQGETVDHENPIYMQKTIEKVSVEVALQYSNSEDEKIRCYTNNAYNPVGGTHLSGFRAGITRVLQMYGKKEGHFKEGMELKGEDFREGLTAVVSIGHPDPHFEAQTKIKLNNPEVEGMVSSAVYEFLSEYLEKNPKEGQKICKRIQLAAEARIAAKKARDAVVDRKKILSGGGLPGKLMDCTSRDREKSELFLVEGDSAGGSAESGRDRYYQAVLPLRGKVLNVERAKLDKLLKNEEISNLITAVGVDIENVEDISKLRYGKIVILTDADVDGQHIRTLLLTFFFRQMRKVIEAGHLFVARPPLFKVTQKKEVRFVQTREEMVRELFARGMKDTKFELFAESGRPANTIAGTDFAALIPVLDETENSVQILERRGHPLTQFLARMTDGKLPMFHVRLGVKDHFFTSADEVEKFRLAESARLGRDLVVSEEMLGGNATPPAGEKGPAELEERFRFTVDEWHEIRTLNKNLAKLKGMGLEPSDLVPLPRVAGREAPIRFAILSGDNRRDLDHLRELVPTIRKLGEKGMAVTRFKGLGEMDPEELWDTTLDPTKRTLLRVTLNDGFAAEKMFRTLMGEEVEGRKQFILNHRANFDDIDYGA